MDEDRMCRSRPSVTGTRYASYRLVQACAVRRKGVHIRVPHFWSSLIGGSSHPWGPKCGTTIDWPSRFLNGFEYVHNDFPSVESHAPLTTVSPAHMHV